MASSSSLAEPVTSAQAQAAAQQRLTETWTDVLTLQNEKPERELQAALTAETRNLNAIQKVKNENTAMKDACLQKASEVKTAQAKESQAQLQLEKSQKEVAALKQELDANASKISDTLKSKLDKEAQIRTLTDKLEKMAESFRQTEADLKKTNQMNMGQLKKVLDATTEELINLKALAMPLKVQTDKRIPSKQLSTIFDDAYKLVAHFFGQLELSDYTFSTVLWHRLTELECLEEIPLPPTNSVAAKQMRVAGVLRLLAEAASSHICQPIHIPHKGTAVADLLGTIDQLDPRRARYVRSVLLGIDPGQQEEFGKKRATTACKDVYDSVSFMLDDRKTFGRALLEWFDKVCNTWRSFQQLEVRYQALFESKNEDLVPEEWEPLPEPFVLPTQTQGQAVNGATPDGIYMKPNPKVKLELANIAAQIWPAFLVITTAGKLEPLKAGYVLLKTQTAAADQELSSHASPETNLDMHRADIAETWEASLSGAKWNV
ncbi:hypothetical protein LA080_005096 [Diaporthe eres]|nr:hypothetical protein LA080_005096 [Diaporthe eres]